MSGNRDVIKRIEAFQSEAILRILGTKMSQVKEEEITNEKIRRRFGSIPKAEEAWRSRQLLFVGRIAWMRPNEYPK